VRWTELLRWLKRHPLLSQIPFVLLSTSNFWADGGLIQDLEPEEFFLKPSGTSDWLTMLEGVSQHHCSRRQENERLAFGD
jgi:hypothetical protein